MRKGQIQLLKRAEKYNFNTEQLELLSREDLPLSFLKKVIIIFEKIYDYPADKAYEYVSSGKNVYELPWIPKGDSLSYQEYISLPDHIKNNMGYFSELRLRTTERDDTYCQFIDWCVQKGVDEVNSYIIYSIHEIIRDKNQKKRYIYQKPLERERLAYYILFCNSLYEYFISNCSNQTMKMLSEIISQTHISHPSQVDNLQKKLDIFKDKKLFNQMSYDDFLYNIIKIIFPNKIYLQNYIKKGIKPKDAAQDIFNNVFDADKRTDIKAFYDLFRDFSEIIYEEYESDENKAGLEYILQNTTLDGKLKIPAYKTKVSVPDNVYENKPVFIEFEKSSYAEFYTDSNGRTPYRKYYSTATLMIYNSGTVYVKLGNSSKYKQAPVRYIVQLFKNFKAEEILSRAIMQIPAIKESYVYKDLYNDAIKTLEEGYLFPSIIWNSCLGFKNRNQLMKSLYNNTEGIDFNKLGIPCGYAYMKTRPYVDDKSQGILYNAFTQHTIKGYKGYITRKKDSVARNVVEDYLMNKLAKNFDDDYEALPLIEVRDYIRNTLDAKQKLSLKWNSPAKIIQKNIDITLQRQNRDTPIITIPKNSVFNVLAENLPPQFERITTKERIIQEGNSMRHCVASYADLVNQDLSSIYHLHYNGHGYTLEFIKKNGMYFINQIQSKANRGAPLELWKYVQELLKDINIIYTKEVKKIS